MTDRHAVRSGNLYSSITCGARPGLAYACCTAPPTVAGVVHLRRPRQR